MNLRVSSNLNDSICSLCYAFPPPLMLHVLPLLAFHLSYVLCLWYDFVFCFPSSLSHSVTLPIMHLCLLHALCTSLHLHAFPLAHFLPYMHFSPLCMFFIMCMLPLAHTLPPTCALPFMCSASPSLALSFSCVCTLPFFLSCMHVCFLPLSLTFQSLVLMLTSCVQALPLVSMICHSLSLSDTHFPALS